MPESHLTWIVNDSLAGLVRQSADVDEVVEFRRKAWSRPGQWGQVVGFLKGLRQREFDVVIDLQGLLRSGVMTASARAARKVGFAEAREGAPMAYTERVTTPPGMSHAVEKNLHVLAAVLGEACAYEAPALREDAAAAAAARALLAEHGIVPGALVAVGPVSRWESKNWPPEFFAETLRRVFAGGPPGARAWLLGTGDDVPVGEQIVALTGDARLVNLMGKTTLPVMMELLKQSRLLLTNDSGPMHIAAALSVPTVALFGPTDPHKTGPYGPGHQIFATQVSCAPCLKRVCPLPEQLCRTDVISPARISDYITGRLLDGTSAVATTFPEDLQ